MSLKPCHECGASISDVAHRCPQCGAKRQPTPFESATSGIMAVGCLLLLIAFVPLALMAILF